MKLGSALSQFLTNKHVLSVVSFLALFNIIGYVVIGKLEFVLYFIIIGVLVGFFSRNMTIILGIPLIVVNLFTLKGSMLEGMENKQGSTTANPVKKEKVVSNRKNKLEKKTGQKLPMSSISPEEDEPVDNAAQSTGSEQQGFESGRGKNRGNEIDYATTIEDAYDELNNILGGDGIQRLTSDTQNLMKQQMQLAEAMKGMGPVIEQIAPMVNNLKGMMGQMGDGKEGLGNILDLAKKFSVGQPK